MFKVIAILATVAALGWAAPTETKTCNGGHKDGETVDVGRYWYVCQNGELIQKGCLSESKARLNAHETYKSNGYTMECIKDDRDVYGFAYKSCLDDAGTEHSPKDTWQDSNYWYTCVMENNQILGQVSGCVDDGKRINVGQSVEKTDLIYTCSQNGENVGFNIFPNHAKQGDFKTEEHVQIKQKTP